MDDSGRVFDVMLVLSGGAERVLEAAPDADAATLAFHRAVERLRREGAMGEVVVRERARGAHALLRQALGGHRPASGPRLTVLPRLP